MAETSTMDRRLVNIVVLGFAFMFMFTAFQTSSMCEQSVLEGAKKESNGTFQGNGYSSLAVIYSVFAVCNWIAPSVVVLIGAKISMILSGLLYTLFIASFLKPMTWTLYTGSVIVGLGAAVIWTAQGNFLTINSDAETLGRNSGIFWALLQCSLLFGNLYVYFAFKGEVTISDASRTTVYLVLTAVCGAGVILLFFLRKPPDNSESLLNLNENQSEETQKESPVKALKRSFQLFFTKEMLLMSVCFAYTGLELTFFSGVYGTSVGHTSHFGAEAKGLIGMCGIFIGVGEIIGGATFGLLGSKTNSYGRDPIVLLGYIVHMAAFYLIYVNLPANSPIEETDLPTFLTSNKYVAVICAFMLGFGDSCFNTQIYSILGMLYMEDSAPAFALYKFVQSVAAAGGFFYSDLLFMQWQLLILVILGTGGALCFFIVEWKATKSFRSGYAQI